MKRTVLRVFGLLLALAGLAALGIGLYGVLHNLPTAAETAADSTSKISKNVPLIGGGIAGLVVGIIIFSFSSRLMASGGRTAAVDYGAIVNQPGGRSYGNMYLYVGILELVLGAVFLVVGLSNSQGGLLATGAILALTGVIFLGLYIRIRRRRAEAQQLEQTGLAATATVTGITQTGMYINEQPVLGIDLQVTAPGKAPYSVHVREMVPFIMLARVQAGQTYPAKVDPNDPEKILVEWQQGGMAGAGAPFGGMPGAFAGMPGAFGTTMPAGTDPFAFGTAQPAPQASGWNIGGVAPMVVQQPPSVTYQWPGQPSPMPVNPMGTQIPGGVPGQATILSSTTAGMDLGGQQLYVLQLQITPSDGRPTYQVTHPVMLPIAQASRVQQGATIPVTIDPSNQNNVVPNLS